MQNMQKSALPTLLMPGPGPRAGPPGVAGVDVASKA